MKEKSKKNVYQTATLVTGLSVVERGLGFLYRIVLSRLIGAEGLGLYQIALSVFSVFLTIGTGGIPVTVSRFISKSKATGERDGERKAVSAGIALCLLLTLPVCIIFALFGKHFSFLFSDARGLDIFSILLVGLVFSSVYAVLRGGFWGDKSFLFPSVLELLEEAVMVIAGILLLRGIETPYEGARLAAVAVVISYLVSFSASCVGYFLRHGRLRSPKGTLKPLAASALPITAVRGGGSLVNSLVAVILPAMLIRAGATQSEALALFGIVSGMVMPVLSIPSTFIGSISLVLVPELAEDYYGGQKKRLTANIERGVFAATAIACILLPLFSVLGRDVGRLLYSNDEAGVMIERCSFMLLPMSLTMITTGVLNSLGFEKQTLLYYFVSAALMILAVFLLPQYIGIYAFPVGLALSFIACALLNLAYLCKKIRLSKAVFTRCLISVLLTLPITFIGKLIALPLTKFFSPFPAITLIGLAMMLITFVFYFFCHILSTKPLKKLLFEK
ncbi:MAG: oligosaccharide flippase family protein [Clostridia bacterium]|nr:oligosaccharide flippase family protein [Clostridia bacterium]